MPSNLLFALSLAMLTNIAWLLPRIGTGLAARRTACAPGSGARPDARDIAPGRRCRPPDLKVLAGDKRPP
jgi:hypothetical protein